MRAILIGLVLAMAGAAHAQTPFPMKLSGDFDGDGKTDFVERTLRDGGVWLIEVTLEARRDFPYNIISGDDADQGAAAMEVLPPATYSIDVNGASQSMTFDTDVFTVDRHGDTRRLIYWKSGFFKSAWVFDEK